ncbi:NucA/NucB deoxyribonuclease domain-containing protein [Kitasatospora sp. NPDC101447]|uniref:NucA/NucB deoxyribonuclease domain-containing protein n=1 Tax=Kitasatospora sp. NPDC101447 TaxID=3364102 RepID=UPI00382F950E
MEACIVDEPTHLTVQSSGGKSATLEAFLSQYIKYSATSRTFVETDTWEFVSATGPLPPMTAAFTPSCHGTCTASSTFPTGRSIKVGDVITWTSTFTDGTTTQHLDEIDYHASISVVGGGTWTSSDWNSPSYRCDDQVGSYAGCVSYYGQPSLNTMALLPAIAANIRTVQTNGSLHYGLVGVGRPLTRDTSAQRANRRAACPPPGPQPAGTTCDEYPFATTREGAANPNSAPPNSGSVWAPEAEQNSQAGYISSFVQNERVLEGDQYWVAV